MNKKKLAFTLAEVLVALTIIGVVAALTVPTMISSYKKRYTTTKLRNFYSVMTQAIKLSEIDNGNTSLWVKADYRVYNKDGTYNYKQKGRDAITFFDTYLAPYLKVSKPQQMALVNLDSTEVTPEAPTYRLADGTVFQLNNGVCMDLIIDVNGTQPPNEWGKDQFDFILCLTPELKNTYCGNENISFCPLRAGQYKNQTREYKIQQCETTPKNCTGLLYDDGFEFKSDYPIKF